MYVSFGRPNPRRLALFTLRSDGERSQSVGNGDLSDKRGERPHAGGGKSLHAETHVAGFFVLDPSRHWQFGLLSAVGVLTAWRSAVRSASELTEQVGASASNSGTVLRPFDMLSRRRLFQDIQASAVWVCGASLSLRSGSNVCRSPLVSHAHSGEARIPSWPQALPQIL